MKPQYKNINGTNCQNKKNIVCVFCVKDFSKSGGAKGVTPKCFYKNPPWDALWHRLH